MKDGPVGVSYQSKVVDVSHMHGNGFVEHLAVSTTVSITMTPGTRQHKELFALIGRWHERSRAAKNAKRSKKKRRHA